MCENCKKVLVVAVGIYYRTGNSAEFIYKGHVFPSYGIRRLPLWHTKPLSRAENAHAYGNLSNIQLYRAKKPDMRLRISQPPKHGVAQFLGHSELAKVESRVASWPFLF